MRLTRRQFTTLAAASAAAPASAAEPLYGERLRPQFHFSPKTGWTNDPNGLVFYKGQYHLFFQHNPFDVKWGNMTWGHAVSSDMVRWKQLANVLEPDRMGTMFSGSAVVDWNNTAGLQSGDEKTIVLIYTAAGSTSPESKGQPFTQCIAYSTDGGRSFAKYVNNPVVPHIAGSNRDPKVVWHAATAQWIMTLFLDGNTYALLASPDLAHWTKLQEFAVPTCSECPDFFEIAVTGEPGVTKWVWTSANGTYLVGGFDGRRFTPEVMTQPGHFGANYYAAQTYSDLPGNRRVQMAWMSGAEYPGMPFNQQMSFPYELRLHPHGYHSYRLYAEPIAEIAALREAPKSWSNLDLKPDSANPLAVLRGDAWDIEASVELGSAREIGFQIRGRTVAYTVREKAADNTLRNGDRSAPMLPRDGRLRLRILVDRASVEVFGNEGEVPIPCCFVPPPAERGLSIYARGGVARILSLQIYPLRSIWPAGGQ